MTLHTEWSVSPHHLLESNKNEMIHMLLIPIGILFISTGWMLCLSKAGQPQHHLAAQYLKYCIAQQSGCNHLHKVTVVLWGEQTWSQFKRRRKLKSQPEQQLSYLSGTICTIYEYSRGTKGESRALVLAGRQLKPHATLGVCKPITSADYPTTKEHEG